MTTLAPKTPRPTYATHYPVMLLAAVTIMGWMAVALWPHLLLLFGITDYGQWYLDSYAVLAANDAVRLGMDPNGANPLDPFLRNHKYSDWWFALRWLGLTREYNFVVGSTWVAAFAIAVWQTVRPRNFREAWWLAALLVSPPVLLAVNRANNDLVIFVLLALCGMAAAGATWLRQLMAVGALVLATGLKFYPAPAALAFLWVRPLRRMPVVVVLAVLAAALALASVWPQLSRGQFTIESEVHVMGAPLIWQDLGLASPATVWFGLGLITLTAAGLAFGRFTVGLATQGDRQERLLAALGAIVLLACFAVGVSYVYRWIFALWMALWLWRQTITPTGTPRQRRTVWLGCGLLFLCFWLDGGLCFTVNLLPPMSRAHVHEIQLTWRLWTQPLHWLLMMLFAGWLLEAAVAILGEWRVSRAGTQDHT